MRCRGLTLIEVMAVVALLGLLAGATAWSLAADARRAAQADVVSTIAHLDHTARLAAQRTGEATRLRFDLERGRVQVVRGDDHAEPRTVALPAGFRLDRMLLQGADAAASVDVDERTYGTVDVPMATSGFSVTYAVLLMSNDETTWLVFTGLTGQLNQVTDEDELDNLFALLATGRADAD